MDFTVQQMTPYLIGLLLFVLGFLLINMLASLIAGVVVRIPGLADRNPRAVRETTSGIVRWTGLTILVVTLLEYVGLASVVSPIIGFFNVLLGYLPHVIGGGLLIAAGVFVARFAQRFTEDRLIESGLDEKLNAQMPPESKPVQLARPIGQVVMVLVLLPFLSAVLATLSLTSVLAPINALFIKLMAFIPNILGAAVIIGGGYFLASILRNLATNAMMASFGAMRQKMHLNALHSFLTPETASILGQVVFAIVLIPLVVQGIDFLGIEAISEPTKQLINRVISVIPNILAGSFFLAIAVAIAAFVKRLVQPMLNSMALKSFMENVAGVQLEPSTQYTFANSISQVVFVAIVALSASQVLQLFGLSELSHLADKMIRFGGHIIIGMVVFLVGMVLAKLASNFVYSTQGHSPMVTAMATACRAVILFLFGAMALRQMGIANEIIEVGFTLLLGAVAVAFALAVGLGGRDIAGQKLARLIESRDTPTTPASF
jgi:hypothetical protein